MENDQVEGYCSICVSSVLALAGAGGVGYSATKRKVGETRTKRNLALVLGIVSILVSILFYLKYRKECNGDASSECSR